MTGKSTSHHSAFSRFQVDPSYLYPEPPFRSGGVGVGGAKNNPKKDVFTSTLRLRFQLRRHHFVQGHVRVKCTATIFTEYFESNELYLTGLGLGEKALESRGTNSE